MWAGAQLLQTAILGAGLRLTNLSFNKPGPCTQTEFQLGCAPPPAASPQVVEFVCLGHTASPWLAASRVPAVAAVSPELLGSGVPGRL